MSQLGLSNLSSDLCRGHSTFTGTTHTHTHADSTVKPNSVFCKRLNSTQVFDISPSDFSSKFSSLPPPHPRLLACLWLKTPGIPPFLGSREDSSVFQSASRHKRARGRPFTFSLLSLSFHGGTGSCAARFGSAVTPV